MPIKIKNANGQRGHGSERQQQYQPTNLRTPEPSSNRHSSSPKDDINSKMEMRIASNIDDPVPARGT